MKEGGAALVKKHSCESSAYAAYIESILKRIADRNLADAVVRVGRQPLRKLAPTDRLVGPANLARMYGLPVDNLMRGIAAAFLFNVEEDEQSVVLQNEVKRAGIATAVAETTGYQEGSEEHTKIVDAYRDLEKLAE